MDNAVLGRAERLSLQARWLNARMTGNPLWEAQEPTPRLLTVSQNRAFVAWLPDAAGRPQIVDVLHAADIEASFTTGLSLVFEGRANSSLLRVSAYPREILPGVFAWLPAFCEFRFAPRDYENPCGTWRATIPMLVRAAHREDVRTDCIRFSPIKEFRAQWPDVSV